MGHYGLRIPGDTERMRVPDPIGCPSSGVGKLVMVRELRRDSQLSAPVTINHELGR